MKQKWAEICTVLTDADKEFTAFIESAGLAANDMKKLQKFIKAWNLLKKQAVDFDTYLQPAEALEIELPFKSEAFERMWKRWKEYLSEQHGILIRSRSEVSALEHLDNISKGDENAAMYYLRYAMTTRYRSFFVVDEKDAAKPAAPEGPAKTSDWDKK